ncbi:dual specificity protein phosphatase 12 [Exidia glandulosa HHB12029]|uniref:protein-tyrosine-phosphatase n=1 Tax=Exidia glandulosa HHB12029 TaxID=1314781 RepID=A0A165PDZ3_EXIGL|nr:dual specificity protein phosphatase 12 [Exidia glandulosa HHB12029]
MDEIIPGLFLGPWETAFEVEELDRMGVTHVLSAMRVPMLKLPERFKNLQLHILDSPKFDILSYFPQCIAFIDEGMKSGGKVLVHCQAGISRSASVVAAYLIATRRITPETALELIRKSRPCIQPNFGFRKQLDTWHQTECIVSVDDKVTRLHYIEKTVRISKAGGGVHIRKDMLATVPNHRPSGNRIRCKMCRRELATKDHMFPHGSSSSAHTVAEPAAETLAPVDDAAIITDTAIDPVAITPAPPRDAPLISPECSGYFLEPLDWMRSFLDEGLVEGKIICPNPKCSSKLGSYAWAGVKCACGEWVTPGFCIHRSKVDEMR